MDKFMWYTDFQLLFVFLGSSATLVNQYTASEPVTRLVSLFSLTVRQSVPLGTSWINMRLLTSTNYAKTWPDMTKHGTMGV